MTPKPTNPENAVDGICWCCGDKQWDLKAGEICMDCQAGVDQEKLIEICRQEFPDENLPGLESWGFDDVYDYVVTRLREKGVANPFEFLREKGVLP